MAIDPNATPDKLDWENQPSDFTVYLKIDVGAKGQDPMTAVYVPSSFSVGQEIDLILYLHGHKGSDMSIQKYLADDRFKLREEIGAANKEAFIFVAPTLDRGSGASFLTASEGDAIAFLKQVMNGLDAYGPFSSPSVGRIVIAAHSGGGAPMQKLVSFPFFQKNVHEVWCFDCLYNGGSGAFFVNQWKKVFGHDLERLFAYSTGAFMVEKPVDPKNPTGPKKMVDAGTDINTKEIRDLANKQGLQNVDVTIGGSWHNIKPSNHDHVPIALIKELINTSPVLT
jgi:hypothetical protein